MHRSYYVAFLVQAAAENRQLQRQTPHISLHHIRAVGEIVGRRGRAADIRRGREAEGHSQAEEGLRITGIARSREDGSWRFYSRLFWRDRNSM